jgi:hypothetical protein
MGAVKPCEKSGDPIISVDCKKKELIGDFKNGGRQWQAKGENRSVNVYDYRSLSSGKALPYGVYDLVANKGFLNVGIDHDTAEFAVASIRVVVNHRQRALPGSSGTADQRRWRGQQQGAQQALQTGTATL